MHLLAKLPLFALPFVGGCSAQNLNLTAITGQNGISVLECWQLPQSTFSRSSEAGTTGSLSLSLGAFTNSTLTIIPARFEAGLHNAPKLQFVYFVSGLAHITLPNNTVSTDTTYFTTNSTQHSGVWVKGGPKGLIIAADTADISEWGHNTSYPSPDQTVALELEVPVGDAGKGGLVYEVLYEGPCEEGEEDW